MKSAGDTQGVNSPNMVGSRYSTSGDSAQMTIWALSPLVLYLDPTLFGLFVPWTSPADFMRQVAKVWLAVGIGGLLFRTIHLFFIRDVETGLVWMTKILTDPFSDLKLYYKSPIYLLKGELIDPGLDLIEHGMEEKHA